jgi:hypothetical protein
VDVFGSGGGQVAPGFADGVPGPVPIQAADEQEPGYRGVQRELCQQLVARVGSRSTFPVDLG